MDQWSAETQQVTPASVDTVEDYVVSPSLEHPQPFTISFDHQRPLNGEANSALRAEISYRTGRLSRTVLCDWRGQASVTAQELQIRSRSYAPRNAPYEASSSSHRHSVMVGLGALAKSSVFLTGSVVSVSTTSLTDETAEINVPSMATRMLLRASLLDGDPGYPADGLLGQLRIQLVQNGPAFAFHNEALQPAHFAQGIDLGEADKVVLLLPTGLGLGGSAVLFVPVFELAL